MKGEKLTSARKGLSDITNSQLPPMPMPKLKVHLTPTSWSYVEKLLQENAELIKLIEEREKMVEVSGTTLQKLRANYQKVQAQNTILAKSNTQILKELNSVKDKLRALQHELVCKDAVLKAKNMEHEEKVQIQTNQLNNISQEEKPEATKPSCDRITVNKSSVCSRRHNKRSQSLGAPNTHEQEDEKLKVPNRRHSLRRQSGRFQTQVQEPEESLFDIEEAKFPITRRVDARKPDNKSALTCSSPTKEGIDSNICSASGKEATKRSSMGRPLRRAAEKVQSYKEIPLNIKMRRME